MNIKSIGILLFIFPFCYALGAPKIDKAIKDIDHAYLSYTANSEGYHLSEVGVIRDYLKSVSQYSPKDRHKIIAQIMHHEMLLATSSKDKKTRQKILKGLVLEMKNEGSGEQKAYEPLFSEQTFCQKLPSKEKEKCQNIIKQFLGHLIAQGFHLLKEVSYVQDIKSFSNLNHILRTQLSPTLRAISIRHQDMKDAVEALAKGVIVSPYTVNSQVIVNWSTVYLTKVKYDHEQKSSIMSLPKYSAPKYLKKYYKTFNPLEHAFMKPEYVVQAGTFPYHFNNPKTKKKETSQGSLLLVWSDALAEFQLYIRTQRNDVVLIHIPVHYNSQKLYFNHNEKNFQKFIKNAKEIIQLFAEKNYYLFRIRIKKVSLKDGDLSAAYVHLFPAKDYHLNSNNNSTPQKPTETPQGEMTVDQQIDVLQQIQNTTKGFFHFFFAFFGQQTINAVNGIPVLREVARYWVEQYIAYYQRQQARRDKYIEMGLPDPTGGPSVWENLFVQWGDYILQVPRMIIDFIGGYIGGQVNEVSQEIEEQKRIKEELANLQKQLDGLSEQLSAAKSKQDNDAIRRLTKKIKEVEASIAKLRKKLE